MILRRPHRIRTLAALPLAALALATSACGAGFHSGTSEVQRPTNGSAGNVGTIAVRNLLLLQDSASPPVTTLIGGLVNNGDVPDQLTAVSVSKAATVALVSPISVPGRGIVTPGVGDGPTIDVPGAEFKPGQNATVTLTFKNSGQIALNVLVMAPNGPSNGG